MKDIELPPLSKSDHPEPRTMQWSDLELYAIQAYARAAVEADRAQRVPDGWKLVPVEPTPKMLVALLEHRERMRARGENAIAREGYSAMLASTPAQPAQQEPPQPVERKPMTEEQQSKLVDGLRRQEGWDGDGWDTAVIEAVERHHHIRE